jgi:outer membrane protein
MMIHHRRPFIFLILGGVPWSLWAQPAPTLDSLSLNDVVRLALSNNPSVQRALADAQASQSRVGQSRSLERPVVEGVGSYTRIDPVPEFDFGGHVMELAPHDNYDVHLGARYNVYDFGKAREQTRLSENRARSAADAVNVARTNVAYAAVRAFYSMLFLQRSLAVQDQEILALNRHLDMARRKVETGTAINYDVLSTQVRVAAVQNQREDALNLLDKQRTALRELLGLPSDAPVNIRGTMNIEAVGLNADSLTTIALRQRTEMQLAGDAEAIARGQQRLVSRTDLPVLRAIVQYGFKNGYEPNLDTWRSNWAGIAQLQVPIYDGRLKDYQRQEAEAALRSEQYKRQALERQIRGEIERAVNDVATALNKLSISEVRIRQASDAVAIARTRYEAGTITNVDVLDAETALAEAQLVQEQAVYSFEMARTSLDVALGTTKW